MKRYNAAAAEKTLAAYNTSTDYDRLHKLAKQGYKIPCFLWDNLHSEDTLFFRLAVCKKIGDMPGLKHFKHQCEKMELRFIVPNIKDQNK